MSEVIITDEMLKEVKTYLRITWNHEDDEVKSMIKEGIDEINETAGSSDYSRGLAFSLLKDYCRYYRSGSVSYFEENHRHRLLKLQIRNAMKRGL